MSKTRLPFAMGLALAAHVALAASPVGSWTGKLMIKMPPVPANATPQQKAMFTQMMGQMSKARIMLNFKADKSYIATMSGMPMQTAGQKNTGKWSQKGNVVTTTDNKAGSTSQNLVMSADGKTMTAILPKGQGKVIFTR